MDALDGIGDGDDVRVTVERRGSDLRVANENVECKVVVTNDQDLLDEQEMNVTGKVTKAIYDTDDRVQMLFVDAESIAETRNSGREEKLVSWDTSSPSKSSNTGSASRSEARSRSDSQSGARQSARSDSNRKEEKHDPNDSLDEIAEDLIGDREFEMTDDEDSVVGAAKRRAKKQQRDPAIDPKLPDGE